MVKIGDERMAEIAPSLPVHAVRGLGNMLRHQYDGLDLRIIFATARESLPQLRVDCVRALPE